MKQTNVEATELRRKVEMRRFRLIRNEDESGVSGVGYVAEGVQFSDGTCAMHWTSVTSCTAIYHSHVELIHIHGHGGKTEIEWIDPEFADEQPPTDLSKSARKKKKAAVKKARQPILGNL